MSYQAELKFAKQLAHDAGDIMRRYFRADNIGTTWKSDNTPLTVADTTINSLVIDRVKKAYPDHAVIGEEESLENTGEFVWVVDPIDGTMPFSLGMPNSTFSLALVARSTGQPVLAIAYDPYLDQLYHATEGGGAYRNDTVITTQQQETLEQGYVFMWHGNHQPETYFDKGLFLDGIHAQKGRYFVVPSFVYYASRIASGEFIGAVLDYGSPWDSASVALLVREAGGIATDVNGGPRRFDEFANGCLLAANPAIQKRLLQVIADSRP